jgi:hypothetical protein
VTESILDAAIRYRGYGWSVLPLCPPNHVGTGKAHRGCGSPGKRPFFPTKAPEASGEWSEFQARVAAESEVRAWWEANPLLNLGVALGPVSGIVGIDVDDEDGDTLLLELAGDDLPKTWEYSTGKGRRLLYRLPAGVHVRTTSFKRPGTEIEILRLMGRGSQVVLPPSVHPNGSVYRWKALLGPDDMSAADVPAWMVAGPVPDRPAATISDGEMISEGGRNNYLTTLAGAMRKRGADEEAIYAALDSTNGRRCDPPLTDLELRSVARSVARYEPDAFSGVKMVRDEPGRVPVVTDPTRRFKWASELSAPPKADDWIWHGYLPRGGIALLSALWKAGKTTLLAHLLKALGTGGEFLGQPIRASRVLYVSEEGEQHWVRRRDDLGFGDHAGFYLQPFGKKPDPADWLGFIGQLKADVQAHGFDLVVFDTLAKLWPVRDENQAPEVDAALMPLWELTKIGTGVLLIHHLRKSGGAEYTASRGSGALSAFPDILIELTRFDAANVKCRKRSLRAKGRYEETPDEMVIELTPSGYVHVADAGEIGADGKVTVGEPRTEEDRILYVLSQFPDPWMTVDLLREALKLKGWGMRDEVVTTHLFSLYSAKQVVMRGVLRSKTTPREYRLTSREDVSPPSHSAPEKEGGNEIDDGK